MNVRYVVNSSTTTTALIASAVLFFGLVFAVPIPLLASEDDDHGTKALTGSQTSPQRLAGSRLKIHDAQLADIFTAGGEVEYDRVTADDVFAAGGSLRLREVIAEDLVIAGGEIDLHAQISDDVLAAGGQVRLDSKTVISGDAIIAGGDVELEGQIDGNVTAAAGRIVLDATVGGDVDLSAAKVEIGPNARIGGELVYRSEDSARISEQAVIGGGVTHEETAVPSISNWVSGGLVAALLLLALLSKCLVAAVAQATIPQTIAGSLKRFYVRPWASWFTGFALLVAVPVAANILLITILGIPLGVLFYALYAVGFTLGAVTTAHEVGRFVTRGERVMSTSPAGGRLILRTALGMVLLGVLALIPILGWLVLLAALPAGVGAFAAECWQRVRSSLSPIGEQRAHSEEPQPSG